MEESAFPFIIKLIIFATVALGDLLAATIIGTRMISRGQGAQALVICGAMLAGIVVLGVVLFAVL